MAKDPRRVKSLELLQQECSMKTKWEGAGDKSDDHRLNAQNSPIVTLPGAITLRALRRTDASVIRKYLNDPIISHCFPDTVYPQQFSLWRAHKLIDEALDSEKEWRMYNPFSTSFSEQSTYQRAIQHFENLNLDSRLAGLTLESKESRKLASSNPENQKMDHRIPTTYAIAQNDTLIGLVELHFEDRLPTSDSLSWDTDPAFLHAAELSYWIGAPYRCQGIMTAVIPPFLEWAWESFAQLERIDAVVYSTWNKASRGLLKKIGFVFEGLLRGGVRKGGSFGDLEFFVLYRKEGGVEGFINGSEM